MNIWNHLQGLEFSQRFVEVGGNKIRVLEAGQGPVLIFLHGTGGHAEAYLRNIRSHSRYFRVMAIDMIGHGYSDAPEDLAYAMEDYIEFLGNFLDTCAPDAPVFISGESLGASVAAWFALAKPQRVAKLVLNTGTLLPPDEDGRVELMDLLERTRKATATVTREAVRARMQWLFFQQDQLTEELVECRYRIYSQPGRAKIISRIVEQSLGALLQPSLQKRWYTAELLQEIKCPTLVLWTRHNPGQGVQLAEQTAKLLPAGELSVLENSGHWPQWEEADKFNDVHIEFLRRES